MTGRTSSTIKPHHKVRTGCFACKNRRIKCDERKPKCSHCERYSEKCVYPDPASSSSAKASISTSEFDTPGILPPREVPKDIDHTTTELKSSDLELMHQWTLSAYSGFGYGADEKSVWREEVLRMALKQPFLMRGILAVSALQLGRLLPEQKGYYLAVAAHHQNLALPSYRYLVEDLDARMTPENCHAILAFGYLTTAYAFASPHPPGSILFAKLCSSTGVPEWVYLLRGAKGIFNIARDWIVDGPLKFALKDIAENIDLSLSPGDAQLVALGVEIDQMTFTSSEGRNERDVYQEALNLLRQTFAIPYQPGETRDEKFAVFTWVELAPSEFLERLSSLQPVALVMLAYLCVLLKKCDHYWYIKGAGDRVIEEVNNILGESWTPWIAWPLQMVQNGI